MTGGQRRIMERQCNNTKVYVANGTEENSHHLTKVLALEDLADLRFPALQIGVGRDDLVEYCWVGHDMRHLLEELGRVEHVGHLDTWSRQTQASSKCTLHAPCSGRSC
jgi:hypothetical protein